MKKKLKWKNIIVILIALISITTLIISIINIVKWKRDNNNTEKIINKIEKIVTIEEVPDSDKTEITPVEVEESNPYWDYIKMNLISVNFEDLKKENPKTVGWLQVNGTNINYPFVQTKDNSYYLNHSFNNKYNQAGWVFMDYRNNIESFDKNSIIYAHGRLDSSMFGSLRNILKSKWLNDPNNFVIKLSTEYENTLWQVFSVYRIPTTNDYIQVYFNSDKEFIDFANMLIARSAYNFNTTLNENDNILTLSTCYNDNDKVVLHAKLIKKERR